MSALSVPVDEIKLGYRRYYRLYTSYGPRWREDVGEEVGRLPSDSEMEMLDALAEERARIGAQLAAARYAIPSLTGCCISCGDRLDIEANPVNDVTCVRVRPHCACNQGVHLWQSLAAKCERDGARAVPAEVTR